MACNTTQTRTSSETSVVFNMDYWTSKVSLWIPMPVATFLLWSMTSIISLLVRIYPSLKVLCQVQSRLDQYQQDLLSGRSLVGVRWQQLWLVYGKVLLPRWLLSTVSPSKPKAKSTNVTANQSTYTTTEAPVEPARNQMYRRAIGKDIQHRIDSLDNGQHRASSATHSDSDESAASVHSESSASSSSMESVPTSPNALGLIALKSSSKKQTSSRNGHSDNGKRRNKKNKKNINHPWQ